MATLRGCATAWPGPSSRGSRTPSASVGVSRRRASSRCCWTCRRETKWHRVLCACATPGAEGGLGSPHPVPRQVDRMPTPRLVSAGRPRGAAGVPDACEPGCRGQLRPPRGPRGGSGRVAAQGLAQPAQHAARELLRARAGRDGPRPPARAGAEGAEGARAGRDPQRGEARRRVAPCDLPAHRLYPALLSVPMQFEKRSGQTVEDGPAGGASKRPVAIQDMGQRRARVLAFGCRGTRGQGNGATCPPSVLPAASCSASRRPRRPGAGGCLPGPGPARRLHPRGPGPPRRHGRSSLRGSHWQCRIEVSCLFTSRSFALSRRHHCECNFNRVRRPPHLAL